MTDVAQLRQVHSRLVAATKPSRELDRAVAQTVSPEMIWRGRPLGNRHMSMAFTRGVENAERFIFIALPGWDWPFRENPTHWRHLDKPSANPNQKAGDHEPR